MFAANTNRIRYAAAEDADTLSRPADVGSRQRLGPTPSATHELRGCARVGCLEVAQLHADYCPLHH